ncbi:MAG: dihydrolipoyllysine-residue acetyltransferase [Nevskiaceae bacterium]|nr:MAG: dihydrolipoyllysine-residue acetyltransferase [Nevskiaceae bacterium]TBR73918.1 MAG: dihydrolipoyllysine-residue acetyltransferase [Nevskiaceae bacterium]
MTNLVESKVPDIGDFDTVPVIEVLVKAGDTVAQGDGLVVLESDKATMEVPAETAGTIAEVKVKEGDSVAMGTVIAVISAAAPATPTPAAVAPVAKSPEVSAPARESAASEAPAPTPGPASQTQPDIAAPAVAEARTVSAERFTPAAVDPAHAPYASPAVRAFARELGVDLGQVRGSGRAGRIVQEDVSAFVKAVMSGPAEPAASSAGAGLDIAPWPDVDFSKFGATETQPLSRINKLSGRYLARNWVRIPHVTQFEEADVTVLEALREQLNAEQRKAGSALKITLLAFIVKACVAALKKYPRFNASLDAGGENIVFKHYFHIGFAADTPNGLVVPVIRDADRKGVADIARESTELAARARAGKLTREEMSGGCFSISSLGGIGGTAFTPIINAPEVAILGVSRTITRVEWDGAKPVPRLKLPLSLSYDHRVIDGALAARFAAHLATLLGDFSRVSL